jgi:GTP-binding protein Era
MTKTQHRSGFVAVVGKPNVGKSTLMNALVGHKISIVTSKPHTTRHAILGVLTTADAQVVFIDTPGLENKSRRLMNRAMNRAAIGAIEGANVIMLVVEAGKWNSGDEQALELVKQSGLPCLLVINKVDLVKAKDKLLPYLQKSSERYEFAELVPVSAQREDNLQRLMDALLTYLPEEDPLYPEEMLTDRGVKFQAAEVLREKLMESL